MTGLHLSWAQKDWEAQQEQERLGAHGPTYTRVAPENLYIFPNVGSSYNPYGYMLPEVTILPTMT
jgi:hypothetical protein